MKIYAIATCMVSVEVWRWSAAIVAFGDGLLVVAVDRIENVLQGNLLHEIARKKDPGAGEASDFAICRCAIIFHEASIA